MKQSRRSWKGAAALAGFFVVVGMGCADTGETPEPEPLPEGVGRTPACETSGVACTWLGLKGENGFNGDGNHRLDTKLSQVQDLLFMPDGTAWFTDFNNFLIRKVNPDDTIESVVGTTNPIFPGDGPLGGVGPDGAPGEEWSLNHPTNLVLQPDGNVLVVGWHNHKLLEVDAETGWVTIVSGSGAGFAGDGTAAASGALYKQPNDAVLGADGSIYILDQQNQRIRKIDPDGQLSTIGGTGEAGFGGDGGPALEALFSWEFGSNPNPSGGIAYRDDVLYISDTENHRIRTLDLDTNIVETIAGNGTPGFSGDDGPALDASLFSPRDLEFGPEGDLYVADTDNGAVRAIDLEAGTIRTVVGTGELGLSDEEALPATEMLLRRPMGLSFDDEGNLYVMDTLNDRIVRVRR